ncbi:hypothetical protein ACHAXN_012495 [Cyclotella atomus]
MLEETVVVAAATGIAATHIGGVTIHSWAGVRLGVGGARVLLPKVLDNAAAWARWRKANVLILDELGSFLFLSMIDGMFFEALDQIGREVLSQCQDAGLHFSLLLGIMELFKWLNCVKSHYEFEHAQLRQRRLWRHAMSLENQPADGIVPTKLYCTNRNVDAENDRNLAALKGREMVYTASDVFNGSYTMMFKRTFQRQ